MGGGSVETYDFCIDNTYSYSYLSFSGYLRAQALMNGYWKRVEERGVDKSPYRAGFAQTILVAETDELPLKQSVREKWMGGNAARVLGLDH